MLSIALCTGSLLFHPLCEKENWPSSIQRGKDGNSPSVQGGNRLFIHTPLIEQQRFYGIDRIDSPGLVKRIAESLFRGRDQVSLAVVVISGDPVGENSPGQIVIIEIADRRVKSLVLVLVVDRGSDRAGPFGDQAVEREGVLEGDVGRAVDG